MKLPNGQEEKIIEKKQQVVLSKSFRAMADVSPVMLWVSDRERRLVYINSLLLQFIGCTWEEYEENSSDIWWDTIHPEDAKRVASNFETSFKKRIRFKMEYRLRRNDGQYRWVIDSGVPHYGEDHQFAGYIGSCVDVHEIKELEQRKAQFITAASHELKTPVTSLTVYLHLIDEYFRMSDIEPFKEYSKAAVIQLNKITGLITGLLDLSRIQSGALYFDWSEFVFADLVHEVVNRMQLRSQNRVLKISGTCKGHVRADYDRLAQAVENLLSNGLKYSGEDKPVEILLDEVSGHVRVSVTDYGSGIAKKHLSKIFERFYRIPGKKSQTYPGMGIGLFLTQKIIQRLRGKISVESKEGEFTKFIIKLPTAKST